METLITRILATHLPLKMSNFPVTFLSGLQQLGFLYLELDSGLQNSGLRDYQSLSKRKNLI